VNKVNQSSAYFEMRQVTIKTCRELSLDRKAVLILLTVS